MKKLSLPAETGPNGEARMTCCISASIGHRSEIQNPEFRILKQESLLEDPSSAIIGSRTVVFAMYGRTIEDAKRTARWNFGSMDPKLEFLMAPHRIFRRSAGRRTGSMKTVSRNRLDARVEIFKSSNSDSPAIEPHLWWRGAF